MSVEQIILTIVSSACFGACTFQAFRLRFRTGDEFYEALAFSLALIAFAQAFGGFGIISPVALFLGRVLRLAAVTLFLAMLLRRRLLN